MAVIAFRDGDPRKVHFEPKATFDLSLQGALPHQQQGGGVRSRSSQGEAVHDDVRHH